MIFEKAVIRSQESFMKYSFFYHHIVNLFTSSNHFKIYFDWAYAGANRMLLACDGERIDSQLELGMLMAEADYLIASEHLDSFERNKENPLVLRFLTEKCLVCEENK